MIRKDFMEMTSAERETLAEAFNEVEKRGLIGESMTTHDFYFSSGIHWRPQFLPWHRYFLRKLELEMQKSHPSVMLPWWDWTRADSRDLDRRAWEKIFGGRDNVGGKFDKGWNYVRNSDGGGLDLPTMVHVLQELNAPDYVSYRKLEGMNDGFLGSHVHAHVWVGGTMASGRSPADPIFYLHHCNIDRLWAIWQQNHAGVSQYESATPISSDQRAPGAPYIGLSEPMPAVQTPPDNGSTLRGPTPSDMLDHTKLGGFPTPSGYGYARDEALEKAWKARFGKDLITESSPA